MVSKGELGSSVSSLVRYKVIKNEESQVVRAP